MQEQPFSQPSASTHFVAHPFCPLTASEISQASELVRSSWPAHTNLLFKAVTLEEPSKKELAPYIEAEHSGASPAKIPRRAFVAYYIRNTVSRVAPIVHPHVDVLGSLP